MLENLSRSIKTIVSTDAFIYTAIIGRPDQLITPKANINLKHICITDQLLKECPPWIILKITLQDAGKQLSRELKIRLPNHMSSPYTMWLDGGMQLVQSPLPYLDDQDIAAHRHFHRTCVYAEIKELVTTGIIDSKTGIDCAAKLIANKHPADAGLHDASFLYRVSNDKMVKFNDDWFEHVKLSKYRDQVWLDYMILKHELDCYDLAGKTRDYLSGHLHAGFATHFQGYMSEPNKPWL